MEGASEIVEEISQDAASTEPLVGMLDMVLLALLAGVSVYYFFIKDGSASKIEESQALKSFTIS